MKNASLGMGLGLLAACAAAAPSDPPATIRRLDLPDESAQRYPLAVPVEPGNTVEVDFPFPIADWAGRGFTPDPERFAGDLVVDAVRGSPRVFVTPITRDAHRVLHVVLRLPSGSERSVPIEFIAAPSDQAWRKVTLVAPASVPAPGPSGEGVAVTVPSEARVRLLDSAPAEAFQTPTPAIEIGIVRTLRLMLALGPDGARRLVAANPALEMAELPHSARPFGAFTLEIPFALRDSVVDCLGLCVKVTSTSLRRLIFDPGSWIVRVGDRVYPVRTADFTNEIEPGATAWAVLVLTRAQDGTPTHLLPKNSFEVSLTVAAAVTSKAVRRMAADDGPSG